jgi:hypothetical protein
LIVGESIIGVLIAAIVAFADRLGFSNLQAPLALVGPEFADKAQWIGGIAFAVIVLVLYRWIARMANGLGAKS